MIIVREITLKLLKIISKILVKQKIETIKIDGKEIACIRGTIRKTPDYDDAWLYKLLGGVKNYIDIGVNVGYTTLLGLVQDDKRVILVDPNPEALSLASKNIIINKLGARVSYHCSFVGKNLGSKVKFFTTGPGEAGSMYPSHAKTAAGENNFYHVDTVSVDYLIDYHGITPDLIKVDVEGAELLVLEGSEKLASKNQTTFFVEMHALEEQSMAENTQGVLSWCREVGYRAFYLKHHEELKSPQTIAHRGKCHLLLLPNHYDYPDVLKKIEQREKINGFDNLSD